MSRLREAAQQALEALERGETKLRYGAIAALKAALAEPSTFGTVVTITERDTAQVCAELCERAHHSVPPFASYEEAAQDCADIIRKHFKIARPE
jgi:hypothetical protein